ncbi:MAG: hypothetical protein HeimC2_23430 [Candidatus Heimdallarchaeota archaeon LC_2]|nr:MAG: hypothetical protein HeimC2_23430 [Candidatus Heimdallarchaeota archaeon LC_2]
MKRIDEKVAISGDGAELIQSYLNELNMKLLAVGITESYSIVMEAETLFISDINELNKTTKVTVFEVQKIIEKHGTPDEIVTRYLKASEAEREDAFYAMDPGTKELIKRNSNPNVDFVNLKNIIYKYLGIAFLLIPPILLFPALLQLNQYRDDFVIIKWFLELFSISNNKIQPFIVFGFLLIIVHEILTSYTGKLFLSLRNTIRIRTLNRSIIAAGAFSSYFVKQLFDRDPYFDADYLNYNQTTFNLWLFAFFITEITILSRDHLGSFYPLQPRFTPYEYFIKLPYILFFISVILFVPVLSDRNITLVYLCLSTVILTTLISGKKKYNMSLRFYSILMLIPMITTIGYRESRPFIYLELILILLINFRKYINEIRKNIKQLINLINSK